MASNKRSRKVTHVVKTDADRLRLITYLLNREMPFTTTTEDGAKVKRTTKQNSLLHHYLSEAVEQGDGEYNHEQLRALCKLHFGIPILCAESPELEQLYTERVFSLPYIEQVNRMMRPLEVPVTSLMDKDQMEEYLNAVRYHFEVRKGMKLTSPEDDIYYE